MRGNHTIEHRLQVLERRSRISNPAGLAALAVVLMLVIVGQKKPANREPTASLVEAQQFRLVDEKGAVLGVWSAVEGGAAFTHGGGAGEAGWQIVASEDGLVGLVLSDIQGKIRGSWFLHPDGTVFLSLSDRHGTLRANLTQEGEEIAFQLYDDDSNKRGKWGITSDGTIALAMAGERETSNGSWLAKADGSSRLCFSDSGGPRMSFGVDSNGTPMMALFHAKAKPAGLWTASPDGSTSLCLSDKSGKKRGEWGVRSDGSEAFWLSDTAGKARLVLGCTELVVPRTGLTEKTPESTITLFDRNQKVIFQIP